MLYVTLRTWIPDKIGPKLLSLYPTWKQLIIASQII